jgi:hypothetical protein
MEALEVQKKCNDALRTQHSNPLELIKKTMEDHRVDARDAQILLLSTIVLQFAGISRMPLSIERKEDLRQKSKHPAEHAG